MAPIATVESPTQINLSWSVVNGYPHYRLYRATARDGTGEMEVYSGSDRSFMDTGRSAGTTYYYTLDGCTDTTAGECTTRSAVRSVTTTPEVPAAPPAPTATVQGTRRIDLSWPPASRASFYRLDRALSSGGDTTTLYTGRGLGYSNANRDAVTVDPDTAYFYTLTACTNSMPESCSLPSAESSATTLAEPGS